MSRVRNLLGFGARPRTAFVFGGGGNLGAFQVGMLKALVKAGIQPDIVLGCSVGAINGAAYASDPTPRGVRLMEQLWRRLEAGEIDVMRGGFLPHTVNLVRKGPALHGNSDLQEMIEEGLGARTFGQLKIPFQCVAAEVEQAGEVWFQHGPLIPALLASSALPVVYPHVEIEGQRFVDGGVVNDVPLSRAVALGARRIFVLHVGTYDRPPTNPRRPIDAAIQASWIARRNRFARDLESVPDKVAVELLPTGGYADVAFNDFGSTSELIDQAYRACHAHLGLGDLPDPSPHVVAGPDDDGSGAPGPEPTTTDR
ncbi:MAG: patatin-like phospholipase family protein [Actinomycetia bacterium]|nr:patatin-like phospholipase family protein [Actinomycetes bacterium]MCP3910426.1 patatin-like phospholipase family protein [Actinomycetes bacterium]